MLTVASALVLASCVGSGQPMGERNLTLTSTEASEASNAPDTQTVEPVAQIGTMHPPAADPTAGLADSRAHPSDPSGVPASEHGAPAPAADPVPQHGTPRGGRHVSLRPMDNVSADDLLDHWGHRPSALLSGLLSQVEDPEEDVAQFEDLLEAARGVGSETFVPGLQEGDTVTVLGQRRDVTYGRWSGGPADTLSIGFDLEHATEELQEDASFRAALERAGKVWSRRIDDTWQEWERRAGESKGRLIGDYGADGREIRVGPEGETSTGLTIYVTEAELGGNTSGIAGPQNFRPGEDWEPHTGAMAFDSDHVEEAGEAQLFHTMVHEIGHVLGAWYGADRYARYRPEVDTDAGTWTGSHVEAVHGGPAPFQDAADTRGWHDGERSPDAGHVDYYHSGVCSSVMAYCTNSAAIPAFLPAEIDFAFLADIGMTILPETLVPETLVPETLVPETLVPGTPVPGTPVPPTDRPETYGHAGWLDYSAFTVAVFRELDVSLADPQPRYVNYGTPWSDLETVDLLWAEADAFGRQSSGSLATSYPLTDTVRYAGGLIGTAVDIQCLPPVYGDATLSFGLDDLRGKASFTSLETELDGGRHVFGGGSLHYPIAVTADGIRDEASGVSLVADFYGPRHEEVAGTLDDMRAGLLASFGARHDERPDYVDVLAGADRIGGMMYQWGFDEDGDGWHRLRCGAGPGCESQHELWGPHWDWHDVAATEDMTPRERVLGWTSGWGEWMSADPVRRSWRDQDRAPPRCRHRWPPGPVRRGRLLRDDGARHVRHRVPQVRQLGRRGRRAADLVHARHRVPGRSFRLAPRRQRGLGGGDGGSPVGPAAGPRPLRAGPCHGERVALLQRGRHRFHQPDQHGSRAHGGGVRFRRHPPRLRRDVFRLRRGPCGGRLLRPLP